MSQPDTAGLPGQRIVGQDRAFLVQEPAWQELAVRLTKYLADSPSWEKTFGRPGASTWSSPGSGYQVYVPERGCDAETATLWVASAIHVVTCATYGLPVNTSPAEMGIRAALAAHGFAPTFSRCSHASAQVADGGCFWQQMQANQEAHSERLRAVEERYESVITALTEEGVSDVDLTDSGAGMVIDIVLGEERYIWVDASVDAVPTNPGDQTGWVVTQFFLGDDHPTLVIYRSESPEIEPMVQKVATHVRESLVYLYRAALEGGRERICPRCMRTIQDGRLPQEPCAGCHP
ncbi:hypothetical protein [Streptosporangium lutulentum]|uniref:Uncharacterized protein n=1 Tax=Streptosporangium lutulentum TaxID=1461250 RepID=A0ABT9QUD7_9ACTN|nr:hypothetical protein [Streptosporangium lutulentum]MDP9850348.1 hypothetical protein [Streptosporangium lutulentum]